MLTVSDISGRSQLCDGGMPLPANTSLLSVCKGAPNFILDYCTEQLGEDGTMRPMTDVDKQHVLDIVDKYSSRALRVLAIAVRTFERMPFDTADEDTMLQS